MTSPDLRTIAAGESSTVDGPPPGRWRLLAPALTSWGVCAWMIVTPGAAIWVICVVATAVTALLVLALWFGGRWRSTWVIVAIGCALLVLLGGRVAAVEHGRYDPAFVRAAAASERITLEVDLVSFPQSSAGEFGAQRSWVRAQAPGARGSVPLLLFFDGTPEANWAPGTRIRVTGVLTRTPSGDTAAYTMRVTEFAMALAAGAGPQERWALRIGEVTVGLRNGLSTAAAQIDGAELVPGFAVGDTSLVSDDLDAAMLESSLTHLTAVSGANCALVTGAIMWLLARMGAGRRVRIAAAAGALAGFVTIVGPDSSVQRAAVMATVLLVSGFGGKRASSLPALGAAIAVLLLIDPWQALQAGFALSVVATGGILLLATPIALWLRRRVRLPQLLALPIGVALAAQVACGPFLLLLQPGIPAVGVLANVLAAPAAPLGTGLGLVAMLLLPLSPPLAHAALLCASVPARWVAATAEVASELPLARWFWPEGWAGALLLAGCQLALLAAWALHRGYLALPGGVRAPRRRPWANIEPPAHSLRIAIWVIASASLGIFVAVTVITPTSERFDTPANWAVVACDVGQGDAVLVRDPSAPEEVMLVDTGDDEERLEACLDRFGVDRIALLVLSHDDRDHVGALPAIIARVEAALISPASLEQRGEERDVVRQLRVARVPTTTGVAGLAAGGRAGEADAAAGQIPDPGAEFEPALAGLRWEVLAPRAEVTPADTNSASVVLMVDAGDTRLLFLGDTGLEEQQEILSRIDQLEADVIKVSHHGSRDQDQGLPARVGAAWALVSVGADNGYGHPSGDTLAALARAGTRTLRTDTSGSIALSLDGGSLRPWVERQAAPDVGAHP
ncbi:ComEC/Rec2 family competence protein [Leucobacter sp. Z1108]|uniref:ComEC/Rec2 family competence protein n=1 Tax=Leucobacter sp. Z1108 TaxID=3439066 RepID=UPI003F2A9627